MKGGKKEGRKEREGRKKGSIGDTYDKHSAR